MYRITVRTYNYRSKYTNKSQRRFIEEDILTEGNVRVRVEKRDQTKKEYCRRKKTAITTTALGGGGSSDAKAIASIAPR